MVLASALACACVSPRQAARGPSGVSQPENSLLRQAGLFFFSFFSLWSDATLFSIAQLEAAVGERERERDKRDAAE